MPWVYLLVAGLFEIGWPLGMKLGWTPAGIRPLPLVMSVLSMTLSGMFLFLAQRAIPMGTAYAVWTGIGAVGTFFVGLALFKEPATAIRFLCVGLIAAGIVGLKLSSGAAAH
jgi:quaternary ammonium compound-resistance protein SugE